MNDQSKGQWFVRVPCGVLEPAILDHASAADWRVLLSIARHQGYQNRRTFPIYIDRTAEEARCTRRSVFRALEFWVKTGVLIKTKRRRMNVYEIAQYFTTSPGMGDSQRHNTVRNPNRDEDGRYVPLRVSPEVTAKGTGRVTARGTPNQKSLSEVFYETPPFPPTGGDAPQRHRKTISDERTRELLKRSTREDVIKMLIQGNYFIPESLLDEQPAQDQRGAT